MSRQPQGMPWQRPAEGLVARRRARRICNTAMELLEQRTLLSGGLMASSLFEGVMNGQAASVGYTLSDAQNQNITNLVTDLAAVQPGVALSQGQQNALQADLIAVLDGKPDPALVATLVRDAAAAAAAGAAITTNPFVQIESDFSAVMASANLSAAEVQADLDAANSIPLASPSSGNTILIPAYWYMGGPAPSLAPLFLGALVPGLADASSLNSTQQQNVQNLVSDLENLQPGVTAAPGQISALQADLTAVLDGKADPALVTALVTHTAAAAAAGVAVTGNQLAQVQADVDAVMASANLPIAELQADLDAANTFEGNDPNLTHFLELPNYWYTDGAEPSLVSLFMGAASAGPANQSASPTPTAGQQQSIQSLVNDLAALVPGTMPTSQQQAALQTDLIGMLDGNAAGALTSALVRDLASATAAGGQVTTSQLATIQSDFNAVVANANVSLAELQAELDTANVLALPPIGPGGGGGFGGGGGPPVWYIDGGVVGPVLNSANGGAPGGKGVATPVMALTTGYVRSDGAKPVVPVFTAAAHHHAGSSSGSPTSKGKSHHTSTSTTAISHHPKGPQIPKHTTTTALPFHGQHKIKPSGHR